MKIWYHDDNDGRCAAAIAYWYFDATILSIECVAVNYDRPPDVSTVQKDEPVIILDYSLSVEAMEQLMAKTDLIIWIDHHRSAIERFASNDKVNGLPGKRDTALAACELTWLYYHPNKPIPHAVLLVGDYDMWRFTYGKETECFRHGLELEDSNPTNDIWDTLLFNNGPSYADQVIDEICQTGRVVKSYLEKWCAQYRRQFAFEATVDGCTCLAMNVATLGSQAFGDAMDKYDVVMPFVYGGETVTASLYSKTHDVGRIAEKFGGGGHPKAAGFQMEPVKFFGMLDSKVLTSK